MDRFEVAQSLLAIIRFGKVEKSIKADLGLMVQSMISAEVTSALMEAHVYKGDLVQEEIDALEAKNKLQAIRLYKQRTDESLINCRKDIEEYMMKRWGVIYTKDMP